MDHNITKKLIINVYLIKYKSSSYHIDRSWWALGPVKYSVWCIGGMVILSVSMMMSLVVWEQLQPSYRALALWWHGGGWVVLYLPRVFMVWVAGASGLRTLGVPLTPLGRPRPLGAASGMLIVVLVGMVELMTCIGCIRNILWTDRVGEALHVPINYTIYLNININIYDFLYSKESILNHATDVFIVYIF